MFHAVSVDFAAFQHSALQAHHFDLIQRCSTRRNIESAVRASISLPGILPRLSLEEALEVTKVYSVAGMLPSDQPLVRHRPFRAPHHTISHAGLVGGGGLPRPGEITLAHHGVLFLDELPEFARNVLEVLRQPLEDGVISLARTNMTLQFPARLMLVGALGWLYQQKRGLHWDFQRDASHGNDAPH